jgi:formylglycine-generating enzyme required for sulfatase activity
MTELFPQASSYRFLRLLGKGGMGEVWLAERSDGAFERTSALKCLRPGASSQDLLQRFHREQRILSALQHPYIALFHDAGVLADGRPYLAMEYVEGLPLIEYCRRHTLTLRQRIELFCKAAEAVQYAHQHLVVHRDLKSGNILIDAEGAPRLLDFGIATLLEDESITGTLGGTWTPQSVSPEQLQGQPVDTAADIYALGLLVYEMLAGIHPYETHPAWPKDLDEVVLRGTPPLPSIAHRQTTSASGFTLRGDLDAIVMQALRKEPERRYESVEAMVEDLQRYLQGFAVRARGDTLRYRVATTLRRHWAVSTALSILILALLGTILVTTRLSAQADDARQRARQSEFREREDKQAARLAHQQIDATRVANEQTNLQLRDTIEQVEQLADIRLVQSCQVDADLLFPLAPSTLPDISGWFTRVDPLLERRSLHEAAQTSLRDLQDEPTQNWREFVLGDLQLALATLEQTRHEVAQRVDQIKTTADVLDSSDTRRRWQEAISSLERDGISLTEQEGLVPLGRDPDSGHWEFWLVASGSAPQRSLEKGRWSIQPQTGLVLVLLPGGEVTVGSHPVSERHPAGTPYADPHHRNNEAPVQTTRLDAFFLSRYEVSRRQLERILGGFWGGSANGKSGCFPAAMVSHAEAGDYCRRLGLILPTEAQWEYAARGGTTFENICDRSNREQAPALHGLFTEEVDDGWPEVAPLDASLPNGFGIHNTLGNVAEWCLDDARDYTASTLRPGDGLRIGPPRDLRHILRGGGWGSPAHACRVAYRETSIPDYRGNVLGFRPSRPLKP